MRATILSSAVFFTAIVVSGAAGATVTPILGDMHAIANAFVDGVTNSDSANQGWTSTPTTLTTDVATSATNGRGTTASSQGSASAAWASASQGSVNFTDYGITFAIDPPYMRIQGDLVNNRGGPDWTYQFTSGSNGVLTINYDVAATGALDLLAGWTIECSCGGSGGPNAGAFIDPTASGTFTADLLAGQTYTVSLDGHEGVSGIGGIASTTSGETDGVFDWSISQAAVPEPASWAMMLLGIGGIGATMRTTRRTQRSTAAATA